MWAKRLFVSLIILSAAVVIYDFTKKKLSEHSFKEVLATNIPKIEIVTPEAHDVARSPLIVKGEVARQWFEEGDFEIALLDSSDREVLRKTVKIDSWKSPDGLYPFEAKLEFSEVKKGSGKIIFVRHKRTNDAFPVSFQLPITFE